MRLAALLDPQRTLAIVCGASAWPRLAGFEPAAAFANTAERLRDYLVGAGGLGLDGANLLWLFDVPGYVARGGGVVSHYDQIGAFLAERLRALDAPDGREVAIVFAYVGHGAFFGANREYCLVLHDTREPEADTSLRVAELARLLRRRAPESSRVLMLDCCFAAEAARHFQGGGLAQAVDAKATEVIEQESDRGVALLCAASARNPAQLAGVAGYTLFGAELTRVLAEGDPATPGPLTLRRVCQLVQRGLQASGTPNPPRPEVHVPDQSGGDLAAVPLFPNPAAPAGELPPGLIEHLDSPHRYVALGALRELAEHLHDGEPGSRRAARAALERVAEDHATPEIARAARRHLAALDRSTGHRGAEPAPFPRPPQASTPPRAHRLPPATPEPVSASSPDEQPALTPALTLGVVLVANVAFPHIPMAFAAFVALAVVLVGDATLAISARGRSTTEAALAVHAAAAAGAVLMAGPLMLGEGSWVWAGAAWVVLMATDVAGALDRSPSPRLGFAARGVATGAAGFALVSIAGTGLRLDEAEAIDYSYVWSALSSVAAVAVVAASVEPAVEAGSSGRRLDAVTRVSATACLAGGAALTVWALSRSVPFWAASWSHWIPDRILRVLAVMLALATTTIAAQVVDRARRAEGSQRSSAVAVAGAVVVLLAWAVAVWVLRARPVHLWLWWDPWLLAFVVLPLAATIIGIGQRAEPPGSSSRSVQVAAIVGLGGLTLWSLVANEGPTSAGVVAAGAEVTIIVLAGLRAHGVRLRVAETAPSVSGVTARS